ncbi:MAG: signal transduction protein [Gammaproteobacteria bacterium]|nr:MAG: signal transduction protein [Gammaproteobacteria bacterium]
MRNLRHYGLQLVALITLYCLSAQASLFVAVYYGNVSPLWLPSGIAIATIWLGGWRWWPMVLIGEIFTAFTLQQTLASGIWGGMVQLFEASIVIGIIRYLKISVSLKTLQDTLAFLLVAALAAPALSSFIGATGLLIKNEIVTAQFIQSYLTWWLGDALGIIVITPLITCWWHQRLPEKRLLRYWLFASLAISAFFVFAFQAIPQQSHLLFFLLLPYVVYSAVILGNQGASLSLAFLSILVLSEALFVPINDFADTIKIGFIGTCALSGFLISALFHEKNTSRHQLNDATNKAEAILHSIRDGVITADINGKVLFLNSTAEQITGWQKDAAIGCDIVEVCPLFEVCENQSLLIPSPTFLSQIQPGENHYLYRFPNKNREIRFIDARIKGWINNNEIAGTVIVLRDITDENILKEELTYQANHDEVTGLGNRRAFNTRLKETLAHKDASQRYAVLYIDLDQFKLVNDTCGHEVGDLMLLEIAELIDSHVCNSSFTARISGDEFGMILPIDNEPHALAMAEVIRKAILHYRYKHDDLVFSVGASIGLTYIHPNDESANAVLSRADIACYQAKETGRNKISTYHAEDTNMLRYQSEIEWISQLKRALMLDQFVLYRQGIYDLSAPDNCQHYEILIRLIQEGEPISPASFLPIAERFGFMPVIDRWVTEKTFQYIKNNPDDTAIYNINLCGNSLNDQNFFADVKQLAKREKIDTRRICFEVTEHVALQNIDDICHAMNDMISLGFKFALDDFGSGVANHSYLEKLPVHYVKLDGQFIRNLNEDKTSQIIVKSLVKVARLKNMQCIAEWIENKDIVNILQGMGIQYGQGYWFDKPAPITAASKTFTLKKKQS